MRIERGKRNTFSFYDTYDYPTIDSTELTTNEVVNRIIDVAIIGRK